jgi:methylated-DNA-protein-cysteine methyltransferase related protein
MSKFKDRVIQAVNLVPAGQVVSYGQIALMVGVPRAAIQVGWILHVHSEKYQLPWWRVINNAGRISTTCLDHTADMQRELLISEGIKVGQNLTLDIEKYRFRPPLSLLKSLELDDEYVYMINQKYLT